MVGAHDGLLHVSLIKSIHLPVAIPFASTEYSLEVQTVEVEYTIIQAVGVPWCELSSDCKKVILSSFWLVKREPVLVQTLAMNRALHLNWNH